MNNVKILTEIYEKTNHTLDRRKDYSNFIRYIAEKENLRYIQVWDKCVDLIVQAYID